ncbi:MAG: class I SAM-dependent methyltransferase [Candidatus Hydrogenedentes bacterium]|nr:class I SAM-dependent methyltransferase [Candidatus Hydrogenedentota bacterium]
MADTSPYQEQLNRIRELKRFCWTREGAAQEYQYCAYKPEPITRMKNLVEIGFVLRYAIGPRVLDAGAGTGRFTFPLQSRGIDAVAVDISPGMLREGARSARKSPHPFRALVGDIERLPFEDNTFDSLVSITVLRHFPDWPAIFDEYLRVVRPGGRIIFDMASLDQQAYLEAAGIVEPNPEPELDPVTFDTGITLRDLAELAARRRLAVAAATPIDVFNENRLLDHVLGERKEAFMERLRACLDGNGAILLYELLSRRVLPAVSPAISGSWFIVVEKREPGAPFRPPFRAAQAGRSTVSPEARLMAILRHCLGADYDACIRECADAAAQWPEARSLLELCRDELLPRFPLDALCWEAGEGAP